MENGLLYNEFATVSEGPLHVHVLSTDKFKMASVWVQLERRLERGGATAMALLPHVLMRGTRARPTPETLLRAFDELYGASVSARAGKRGDIQTLELTLQLPAQRYIGADRGVFGRALQELAAVLLDPRLEDGAFSPHALDVERKLHRQRIENVVNDKMSYASERCVQVLCGEEPYGIPRLGYKEDLDGLTPALLYEQYRELLASSPLHVYAVGHDGKEEVAAAVRSAFAAATARAAEPVRAPSVEPSAPRAGAPRTVVERMDVNQGKLNMGLRTGIGYASDDYPALLVYNGVLGAFEHSKLFVNVREKASLAYYAYSRLETLKGLLLIGAGIRCDRFEQARGIILEQLDALRRGEVSDEELAFTKEALISQYLQSDDQPFTPAMMQMFARFSGRSRSVEELMDAVRAVGVADVARVAQAAELDTVYFLRDEGEVREE